MNKKIFLIITAVVVIVAAIAGSLGKAHAQDSNGNRPLRNIHGSIGYVGIAVTEVDGQKFLIVRCGDGLSVVKFRLDFSPQDYTLTIMKLNRFQSAWLNALESGKYRRTTGVLARVYSGGSRAHCCLGVGCVVARKMGEKVRVSQYKGRVCYNDEPFYLSKELVKALGLRTEEGALKEHVLVYDNEGNLKESHSTLAQLNDNAGWSHRKIAAYIRQNPENVFFNR